MLDRIIEIRQKIFTTQAKEAEALQLTRQAVTAYEKGKAFFKPHTLQLLADRYNININWLLTGKGNMLLSDNDNINTSQQLQALQEENKRLQAQVDLLKELVKK